MSWRKIARPQALPQGAQVHRRDAAERLRDFFTGGQGRGDIGARLDFLTGQASRDVPDLVRDIGDTHTVAKLTGAAERTVRDWRAGRHAPSAEHRAALEKEARRATVAALGGTKAVATITGRSASTVRSWVRKHVEAKGDAVHQLNRHEVRDRFNKARRIAGLAPGSKLFLKMRGHVRVRPAGKPDYSYDVDRNVTVEISPFLEQEVVDAIARGDDERVQQLIEETLSEDYADLGPGTYDGDNQGFFMDRIDEAEMQGDSLNPPR